jgi:hypothetical protein
VACTKSTTRTPSPAAAGSSRDDGALLIRLRELPTRCEAATDAARVLDDFRGSPGSLAASSWTGQRGPAGRPLVALAVVWLLARLVPFAPSAVPNLVVALVDPAYLPMVGALSAPAEIKVVRLL